MPANTILIEVQKLNDVSARLDCLAGKHPVVSEGLLAISARRSRQRHFGSTGHVENVATLGTAIDRANSRFAVAAAEGALQVFTFPLPSFERGAYRTFLGILRAAERGKSVATKVR
jgi:hypothetical protein